MNQRGQTGRGEHLTAGPFRVTPGVLRAVLTRLGSLYTALNEDEASLLWEELSLTKGESKRAPKKYWGEGAAPASQVNELSPSGGWSQQMLQPAQPPFLREGELGSQPAMGHFQASPCDRNERTGHTSLLLSTAL